MGHNTSIAHIIQAMNGISILDYMMTREDVDITRVGVNGGSGGGTQTVLLSVLDDRYTAACPVVSLASHFDGGCPCESGMPVTLASRRHLQCRAGRPLRSEAHVRGVRRKGLDRQHAGAGVPYLQKVYGFYGAADKVINVHLPKEGHDFGPNKRNAVYDFFADVFRLDKSKLDESKVTIEPFENLYSFGKKGEKMPENAIRSVNDLGKVLRAGCRARRCCRRVGAGGRSRRRVSPSTSPTRRLPTWPRQRSITTAVPCATGTTRIPIPLSPSGPGDGPQAQQGRARDDGGQESIPESVHARLLKDLNRVLTPEQVEQVFDGYTVGKVAFTMKGYYAIVPDLTDEEARVIEGYLKQAREEALECKSMKAISQVFEVYKSKCEQYLNSNGRNWRQLFKDYVNKRNAEKESQEELGRLVIHPPLNNRYYDDKETC